MTDVADFREKNVQIFIVLVLDVNAWLLKEVDTWSQTIEGNEAKGGSHLAPFSVVLLFDLNHNVTDFDKSYEEIPGIAFLYFTYVMKMIK